MKRKKAYEKVVLTKKEKTGNNNVVQTYNKIFAAAALLFSI